MTYKNKTQLTFFAKKTTSKRRTVIDSTVFEHGISGVFDKAKLEKEYSRKRIAKLKGSGDDISILGMDLSRESLMTIVGAIVGLITILIVAPLIIGGVDDSDKPTFTKDTDTLTYKAVRAATLNEIANSRSFGDNGSSADMVASVLTLIGFAGGLMAGDTTGAIANGIAIYPIAALTAKLDAQSDYTTVAGFGDLNDATDTYTRGINDAVAAYDPAHVIYTPFDVAAYDAAYIIAYNDAYAAAVATHNSLSTYGAGSSITSLLSSLASMSGIVNPNLYVFAAAFTAYQATYDAYGAVDDGNDFDAYLSAEAAGKAAAEFYMNIQTRYGNNPPESVYDDAYAAAYRAYTKSDGAFPFGALAIICIICAIIGVFLWRRTY